MRTLPFWFDFASTYSYVTALRIEPLASSRGFSVDWRPFLLGPIFKRQGWNDSPFNLNPARGRYMWRDIERLCRKHALPFRRPSIFPRNSLLAARVACAAEGRPWIPEFCRAVFRANFAEDREISEPPVLAPILEGLGEDADALLAAAQAVSNKEKLRVRTESAWNFGIFGAPTFIVDGEMFWGNDRLEDALEWRGETA